ncbi:hypothetical protein M3936_08515 [Sutcliffiella horikoshii]|uniref:hypothetical protein n=1 Tax=Sutcliffiella horikoshii TaxID=79883 RepID=UPI0007D0A619|nr:hypothetical protein [Sutcliffiella horikoshii]MCM3617622.1 hypothetical protein [Sutcliffiella horikoshii]
MLNKWKDAINWSLAIAVITLVLAAIFSIVSTYLLSGVTWAIGMIIVFIIVFIGIFFDMLGIAATAADETPFHAMAAERVNGSKQSIQIVRSADRFASFCNDVIGDISGIISGTASAIVVISFTISIGQREDSFFHYVVAVAFTSVVAAVTVGGKAFGKSMAIRYSTPILFQVGKLFYFLEDRFKIVVMKENKNKRKNKRNQ